MARASELVVTDIEKGRRVWLSESDSRQRFCEWSEVIPSEIARCALLSGGWPLFPERPTHNYLTGKIDEMRAESIGLWAIRNEPLGGPRQSIHPVGIARLHQPHGRPHLDICVFDPQRMGDERLAARTAQMAVLGAMAASHGEMLPVPELWTLDRGLR